jgi:hypothetical protein
MHNLIAAVVLMLSAGTCLAAGPVVINGKASSPEGPVMSDGKLLHVEHGAHKVDQWDGTSAAPYKGKVMPSPTSERRAVSPSPL